MHKNTKALVNKIALLILLLAACTSSSQHQAPLDAQKMKGILLDIHYAEAYSSLMKTDSSQKKFNNKNIDSLAFFYKEVLDHHQVSIDQFESALKWYSIHPQELDTVYAKLLPVLDSLKTIQIKPDSSAK